MFPDASVNQNLLTMATAVIYARVSSVGDRQSTTRQVEDLKRYISFNDMELINIYEEKMSGTKESRPILTECIEFCIKNHVNTLCVSEISRLGRSVKIVVNTIDQLTKAGVNIYIQNIQLSTLDSEGQPNAIAKMITAVLSSFSEVELNGILYRLQSGRRVAIEQHNVKLGRKVGSVKTKEQKQEEYSKVIRSLKQGKSIRDTAVLCDVSVSTVFRVKREFGL